MKYFDICTKREYEKNGEKKAVWLKCGTLKQSDEGRQFIELNMFPSTSFYVFEQKKREDKTTAPEDINWSE
jgi:hypothetical protein